MKHPKLCKVCGGIGNCDMEIHEATLRIHAWLKERIEYALMPVEIGKAKGAAK